MGKRCNRINKNVLKEMKNHFWWNKDYQNQIDNILNFIYDFDGKSGIIYEVSEEEDKKLIQKFLTRQK